jgi:phosphate transport system protein
LGETLARLLDIGLEKLNNMLLEMAKVSKQAVEVSISAYRIGELNVNVKEMAERLRVLHNEVSELAMELLARYQPVASDLRFIKACMEISYGFFRFGRYAYDIMEVLEIFGDLSKCDHTLVLETAKRVQEMIEMSIIAFVRKDLQAARKIPEMDDFVDSKYRENLLSVLKEKERNIECHLSATLILRYLERIADHASYIAESVVYIVSGQV